MSPYLLLVDPERELRSWLRHHIEILWPDGTIEELEPAQLQARCATLHTDHVDLLVLGAECGEALDDPAAGFDVLRALLRLPNVPPLVIVAAGGNELSAVQAIRLGAADYLPRRLLNAQRLATALRRALLSRQRVPQLRTRNPRGLRRRADPSHLNLPQYSILHKLGESARAVVYLAHSATLGRNVALKISKPNREHGDDCEEFAREYAAISALRDPSVVDIYDYGFHDGREFIAMEYFPCGDLKTRLQQPISVAESLGYAQRICAALQVVHGAGLIHRDLKPPNVMLRDDGSVVLIDFGLAKNLDAANRSTVAGVLRGSPYYMSPEQAQGQRLDARCDLYSAGVILFEMLSGAKPYGGSSAVEVMQQHVRGPRPPLPAACAALEPLLDRFMARERSERFADADAALAALAAAIEALRPEAALLDEAVGQR
jgi:DNA-binding NarL/FixJ family response regulator